MLMSQQSESQKVTVDGILWLWRK